MESKTVALSVLIMSLVLARIHVEAGVCCPTKENREAYDTCRKQLVVPPLVCAQFSRCKYVEDSESCPPGYPYNILENSGNIVNEYCKLGCVSSVCGALTTLHNSDPNEIVNQAVEQCTKACSTLCTKGSKTTLETA